MAAAPEHGWARSLPPGVSPRRDFVVAPIDDGVEFIAANDGPGSTCSPSGFVGPVVVIHSSRLP